jgi:hypothetical protein
VAADPAGLRRASPLIYLILFAHLALSSAAPAKADFNAGDVAVFEADATLLEPGEDFDLAGKTVTFTPKGGGGYTISTSPGAIDPRVGSFLGLGDDATSSPLFLGFAFPFFGTSYGTVFVNSNGYLTFGAGSSFINFNSGGQNDLSTVLDRMAEGLPRVAALWNDLDPSQVGGVFFNTLADRVLITWDAVPRFEAPATSNTFQIALFPSGVIRLTYGSIGPPSTDPVFGGFLVGISPGSQSQFQVTTLDFHTGTGGSFSTSPNSDPLVQVFGSMPNPLLHLLAVARRLYQVHDDLFDQMLVLANFNHAMDGAFAFEIASRISMGGTGQGLFNESSAYGSAGRLHSVVNLGMLAQYPDDPLTTFLGTNSTLDVIAQEAGHQWLAFLNFNDGGVSSDLLLGRQRAHWSFFHDTDASDMEGNNWVDNGNGTFTSNEATARYSALDQYAMGLRSASEVQDFFFIDKPSGTSRNRNSAPEIGVTTAGTRRTVSISQVIAIDGSRPSGFTGVNPTAVWRQAFVLLVKAGTAPSSLEISKIDAIRSAWVQYFANAVGGRGSMLTSLVGPDAFITRLYRQVLGREPDPGGLAGWIQRINQDGSVVPAVLAFFHSSEFLARNTTDEQFVAILYRTFLNRGPDPVGFNALLTELQAGRLSRDDCLDIFIDSPEFAAQATFLPPLSSLESFVTNLYVRILGRGPDPSGLQGFVAQLQQTRNVLPTVRVFLSSPEFLARQTTDTEFVTLLYRVFLGRVPDTPGLATFVAQLASGSATRDQLVALFAASPEFQAIQQALFP